MDTDPPLTCDYIFVRGKCEIVSCMVDPASAKCHQNDPTIYGSDHVAILADLIIWKLVINKLLLFISKNL